MRAIQVATKFGKTRGWGHSMFRPWALKCVENKWFVLIVWVNVKSDFITTRQYVSTSPLFGWYSLNR